MEECDFVPGRLCGLPPEFTNEGGPGASTYVSVRNMEIRWLLEGWRCIVTDVCRPFSFFDGRQGECVFGGDQACCRRGDERVMGRRREIGATGNVERALKG